MKLWLLERKNIRPGQYDVTDGFVIRAETATDAREMANTSSANEGYIWEDPPLTTCTRIDEYGEPEIILCDNHAG
jgi:hypothetical protein